MLATQKLLFHFKNLTNDEKANEKQRLFNNEKDGKKKLINYFPREFYNYFFGAKITYIIE